ncbi:DUF4097 family beta strand repeat-containing protein [Radiobacillus sp. PE A8.2]|uniref:DUF4097 family beta strand repeat-containing protein n=1 Tax=Radiobacillus sp. PE A8.2 TaxID=3380349 RepID=UPI00388FFADC
MNDERKKVLKMIEEGLISSEEAEELLDSLEKAKQADEQATTLSKQVNWDEQSNQKQKSTSTGKKASILQFVEEAFHKIKHADLDFNFGTYFDVSHIFHHDAAHLKDVDIDVSNGNVDIQPWSEQDIRITCKAKVYQVENQDEARRTFLEGSELKIDGGVMRFYIPSKQIKTNITIHVPRQQYAKVSVRLFNGAVDVKELEIKQLQTQTKNGALNVEKVIGDKLELETTSGSIKVKQAQCQTLEAETINGSVKLNGAFEKVDAQTVSGSIHCDWHGNNARTAFIKTTTGSIRLTVPQSLEVDGQLKTNIGSIQCDINNYHVIEEKKEMLQRQLHFTTYNAKEDVLFMEAEAKTGSIWVRAKEDFDA